MQTGTAKVFEFPRLGNTNDEPITDVIARAGGGALGIQPPTDAVGTFLRNLADAAKPADPMRRELLRAEAVRVLTRAKVHGPARLVDAAFGTVSTPDGDNDSRQGKALTLADPEPWHEPVDGAELLGEVARTVARFLTLPEGAATAVALFSVFTHAHDAFTVSPVLNVKSPEKRCGKTTLLYVLQGIVTKPLSTANISVAALFRVIDKYGPTLIIDEADTFLENNPEMAGVLNSGHTRAGASVVRNVGDEHEPRFFSTWCPKVVAGIGDRKSTLTDRSIVIPMQRQGGEKKAERLRLDRLADFEPLRQRAARWAADNVDALRSADPEVPESLHDRAADNWRPLLAIADLAGGTWGERARKAAELLSGGNDDEATPAVQLLEDLRDMFAAKSADKLHSDEIVHELHKMEHRPWPEWKAGKPMTNVQLARLLKRFEIRPKQIRIGDESKKGYELDSFRDAFARYASVSDPKQAKQSSNGAENPDFTTRNTNADPDPESGAKPRADTELFQRFGSENELTRNTEPVPSFDDLDDLLTPRDQ